MKLKYQYQLGTKINYLTIVGQIYNQHNQKQIICKCECGNEIYVMPYSLFNNKTKSCGCHKKKALSNKLTKYKVGSKLGLITLIKELGKDINGKRRFTIKCECGTSKNISIHYGIKSCGCLKRRSKDPDQTEFNRYKYSCLKRNILFQLTKEQFSEFIHKNCYYCNAIPSMKMHAGKLNKNGIDRIDSYQGYLLTNCISCCAKCNFAKRQLSIDDFFKLIKTIYEIHFMNKK